MSDTTVGAHGVIIYSYNKLLTTCGVRLLQRVCARARPVPAATVITEITGNYSKLLRCEVFYQTLLNKLILSIH